MTPQFQLTIIDGKVYLTRHRSAGEFAPSGFEFAVLKDVSGSSGTVVWRESPSGHQSDDVEPLASLTQLAAMNSSSGGQTDTEIEERRAPTVAADQFLADLIGLCFKHGVTLSHEDTGGAFIVRHGAPSTMDLWRLLAAKARP
jgi:hypothetical protein